MCIAADDLSAGGSESTIDALKLAGGDLLIVTKSDLATAARLDLPCGLEVPVVATSSRTGEGVDEFIAVIGQQLYREESQSYGPVVAATAERCRESVYMARAAVDRAGSIAAADAGDELVAAELRMALDALGKVVGAVYTDDLLDRIFKTFCIGK